MNEGHSTPHLLVKLVQSFGHDISLCRRPPLGDLAELGYQHERLLHLRISQAERGDAAGDKCLCELVRDGIRRHSLQCRLREVLQVHRDAFGSLALLLLLEQRGEVARRGGEIRTGLLRLLCSPFKCIFLATLFECQCGVRLRTCRAEMIETREGRGNPMKEHEMGGKAYCIGNSCATRPCRTRNEHEFLRVHRSFRPRTTCTSSCDRLSRSCPGRGRRRPRPTPRPQHPFSTSCSSLRFRYTGVSISLIAMSQGQRLSDLARKRD